MVDLSQLKKGKHIRTTNGNICKVLSVKNSGDVYFIVTENVQKTGFYNNDGTPWGEDHYIKDSIKRIF